MEFARLPLWSAACNVWPLGIAGSPTKFNANSSIRELTPPQDESSFSAYLLGIEFHGDFKRLEERCLLPENHRRGLRARQVVAVAP